MSTPAKRDGLDPGMFLGIAVMSIAMVAGIAATGISARYFCQPTGLLIVFGGTIGAMLVTTPITALIDTIKSALSLFSAGDSLNREDLIEELVSYAKIVRFKGILAIEPVLNDITHGFLKDGLSVGIDSGDRNEMRSAMENKIRIYERESDSHARILEIAGGFSPTMGVLGTVVGLVDILRQFSTIATIGSGVAVAFTSTIYGLAFANLLLLPAAYRIRARALENLQLQELMMEGALCLFDGFQPRLLRHRLEGLSRVKKSDAGTIPILDPTLETH